MNSECSLTSVPTFLTFKIKLDEHDNLDFECDDQGDLLLNQSENQEEPMEQEVSEHEEKQS